MWVAEERVGGLGVSACGRLPAQSYSSSKAFRPTGLKYLRFELWVIPYATDLIHAIEIEDEDETIARGSERLVLALSPQ